MARPLSLESIVSRASRWAAGAALALTALTSSAYTVSLTPATQTVGLGSEVVVDLVLSDLGPAGLGSFDFNLTFDTGLLDYLAFVDGGSLGFSVGLSVFQAGNVLTISDFSFDDPAALLAAQQGAGAEITLASLRFGTLAAGPVDLLLSTGAISDVFGVAVDFTQADAEVVITERQAVPTPGTGALVFAAGLAAFLNRRRTRA
jgi:hypothetical protein